MDFDKNNPGQVPSKDIILFPTFYFENLKHIEYFLKKNYFNKYIFVLVGLRIVNILPNFIYIFISKHSPP